MCKVDTDRIIDHETETLRWIKDAVAAFPTLHEFRRSAEDAYFGVGRDGFRATLRWETIGGDGRILYLAVGGILSVTNSELSYALCVAEDNAAGGAKEAPGKRMRLLRKYHFDQVLDGSRDKPRFHIQSPGTLWKDIESEIEDAHADPGFELPRLLYPPMSLALTLQTAFTEFRDDVTDRIREDNYWRSKIVHRDQTDLVLPYLNDSKEAIEQGTLLLDHYYA